ncbi:hypothetical protein MMC14_010782 [Varicellaria rhodocarpa]|nr:hypothetical protein [Varicellaria rhodocarpa]
MSRQNSSTSSTTHLSTLRALEIVRNSEPDNVSPNAIAKLESANREIWARIKAKPDSYVMSENEFAVFNFYRGPFMDSEVGCRAVGRFWDHYRQDTSEADGSHRQQS